MHDILISCVAQKTSIKHCAAAAALRWPSIPYKFCLVSTLLFLFALPFSTARTHKHTYWSGYSQDFFVLSPVHSNAKGLLCDLHGVADGAGWVTVEAVDVLMGDLKPLPVGIVDLRRGNSRARAVWERLPILQSRLYFVLPFCPFCSGKKWLDGIVIVINPPWLNMVFLSGIIYMLNSVVVGYAEGGQA